MTEDEKSGPREGGEALPNLPEESGQPAQADEGKDVRMVDFGIPHIEKGATLGGDDDAIAEAAKTSLDMEGFETGAGFDLEDSPDEGDRDLEIEMMEVRSSAFDEVDFLQADTPDSAEPGGEAPVVDTNLGGSAGGSPRIPDAVDLYMPDPVELTIQEHADLTIPDHDDGSLLLPTPTPDRARPKARHRGLEALERQRKRKGR